MTQCDECKNRFILLFNKIKSYFNKQQELISKTDAFNNATYGRCMNRKEFILQKQSDINSEIKFKLSEVNLYNNDFDKYFLVLSFNEIEESCAKEIFEPFIANGYTVEKISEHVSLLKDTNVYILTWKNL